MRRESSTPWRWFRIASAIGVLNMLSTGCASHQAHPSTLPVFVVPNSRTSPFSSVVRVGDMLYVSGQIGTDSTGALPKGGIGPETTEAMKHISRLLVQAGSSLDHVVKCTVMLSDMSQWGAMNQAYMAFFPERRPARSSFGATALAQGAHVEIECMATAG
jgi:lysine/arginine/ornithine transport system substrate-binding protein